jgi:hypothetical protein
VGGGGKQHVVPEARFGRPRCRIPEEAESTKKSSPGNPRAILSIGMKLAPKEPEGAGRSPAAEVLRNGSEAIRPTRPPGEHQRASVTE